MEYLQFFYRNWRYLTFGSLLTGLGTLGSQYFLGLFNGEIRQDFDLSHAELGLIFSITTLASGPVVIWFGRKIDEMDLRLYIVSLGLGFSTGCFLLSWSASVLAVGVGIFLIRLVGDWLILHTAVTSMARFFGAQRGRALGVGAIGYAVGPAVFPVLAAMLIGIIGWRVVWLGIGVGFLLLVIPVLLWLLRGEGDDHTRFLRPGVRAEEKSNMEGSQWTRRRVFGDIRFYQVMPVAISLPFILAAFFFHQVHMVEAKGWTLTWLASCFVGFAIGKVVTVLIIGPMIDRFGAIRILPYFPLPMGLGLLALVVSNHPSVALIYLTGAGISTGMWLITMGALWAEMYGVQNLGAIRSVAQAIFIVSTAFATVGMGWLLDHGVTFERMALVSIGYIGVSIILAASLAFRQSQAVPRDNA